MKFFVFLLLAGTAIGIQVQEKEIEKNLKKLEEEGILRKDVLEKVQKYKEEVKPLAEKGKRKSEEWEIRRENGKMLVEKREKKAEKEEGKGRKIYVFMSSSVPEEIWDTYMDFVLKKKLNAVFLLRGCIGGCRYIKPTLVFIRKVLKDRPVEVWIDPLKFRQYGVKAVPCVALEGEKRLSCGDWNLEYHLRKLGRRADGED